MKSPQLRRCWPNSALLAAPSSRWTRCTAKKLLECAAEAKVTLIIQVKDNQPTLLQRCRDIVAANTPLTIHHSHTKGRNRDESRKVRVSDPADTLAGTPWRHAVAAVIQVEREVFIRSTTTGLLRKTTGKAFYICNAAIGAERTAAAIRGHWSIENTSNYARDVTLGEDRSRISTKPGVFARLRSFASNISNANQSETMSQDRYRAALADVKNLLQFKGVAER